MSYKVLATAHFAKDAKRLGKKYPSLKKDLEQLITKLEQQPGTGIVLGHNLFKIRLAIRSKGKGKSGGARVITYVITTNQEVLLTSIYDKSEISSISTDILLQILRAEGIVGNE